MLPLLLRAPPLMLGQRADRLQGAALAHLHAARAGGCRGDWADAAHLGTPASCPWCCRHAMPAAARGWLRHLLLTPQRPVLRLGRRLCLLRRLSVQRWGLRGADGRPLPLALQQPALQAPH